MAVELAIRCGYRHVDCAAAYGNEPEVGVALKKVFADNVVSREELFITSKLWNSKHDPRDVMPAAKKTLADLGLSYVDLYLIHWPVSLNRDGNHPRFPKLPDGTMDYGEVVRLEDTWQAMEEVCKTGLARHIGISNFNSVQVERIVKCARIPPVINQCECHPYHNQKRLMAFCAERNIAFEVYSPLGNPGRPQGWDHSHPKVMENEVVVRIAKERGVTPAAVCVRFQIQRGNVVLVKSVTPSRIKANLEVWGLGFELTEEDMQALDALDCELRYGEPSVVDADGNRRIRDIKHPEYPWKRDPEVPF